MTTVENWSPEMTPAEQYELRAVLKKAGYDLLGVRTLDVARELLARLERLTVLVPPGTENEFAALQSTLVQAEEDMDYLRRLTSVWETRARDRASREDLQAWDVESPREMARLPLRDAAPRPVDKPVDNGTSWLRRRKGRAA